MAPLRLLLTMVRGILLWTSEYCQMWVQSAAKLVHVHIASRLAYSLVWLTGNRLWLAEALPHFPPELPPSAALCAQCKGSGMTFQPVTTLVYNGDVCVKPLPSSLQSPASSALG